MLENALYFKNGDEWHQWLKLHHDREAEAWLVYYKKDTGKRGVSYNEAVDEALCFGWIDGKLMRLDEEKYVIRFTPRKSRSVWSRINRDKAEKLIEAGKMTPAGLARIEEARHNGFWENAYTNKKRERMPSDLKKALLEDKKAWENFSSFANSYRNMYIGWVNDARKAETRGRRIEEVVKRALVNKKPGIE